MNTKKLIGTIIGVTLFAALIAGATYAWLTATATVTNGNTTTTSKQLTLTYSKGTDVTDLNMLDTATASDITDGKGLIVVTATRPANAAKIGEFNIMYHINEDTTLTTASIRYQVCEGECSGTLSGTTIPAATNSNKGTDIEIYTTTFDTNDTNNTTELTKTYYIYFWLDGPTISNDDLGTKVSGYVWASAFQNND